MGEEGDVSLPTLFSCLASCRDECCHVSMEDNVFSVGSEHNN